MRCRSKQSASNEGGAQPGRRAAVAALLIVCTVAIAGASQVPSKSDRRQQEKTEEAARKEGEALLNLADEAMSGRSASDFAIQWRNDFFKAQAGTFVPFTVTIDRSKLSGSSALMYVRAALRESVPPTRGREVARYPFDIIFPVELGGAAGQTLSITRGFAVPPGEYDVYVALRERPSDPAGAVSHLKSAVLKQPLSVPDFWTGDLTTSSVVLADRIDTLPDAIAADEILERPYVIGQNEIHPAAGPAFRRDRELIVVFLIYNPTVSVEKDFDVEVDYHLFRRMAGNADGEADSSGAHPPARAGERYVTRTNPQRFKPSLMGAHFDAAAGHPMMAGQGILLSSFQEGEYRLGITVTDLLSRKTLSRDVTFTVVGS
jgi:hypothetical protein